MRFPPWALGLHQASQALHGPRLWCQPGRAFRIPVLWIIQLLTCCSSEHCVINLWSAELWIPTSKAGRGCGQGLASTSRPPALLQLEAGTRRVEALVFPAAIQGQSIGSVGPASVLIGDVCITVMELFQYNISRREGDLVANLTHSLSSVAAGSVFVHSPAC